MTLTCWTACVTNERPVYPGRLDQVNPVQFMYREQAFRISHSDFTEARPAICVVYRFRPTSASGTIQRRSLNKNSGVWFLDTALCSCYSGVELFSQKFQ